MSGVTSVAALKLNCQIKRHRESAELVTRRNPTLAVRQRRNDVLEKHSQPNAQQGGQSPHGFTPVLWTSTDFLRTGRPSYVRQEPDQSRTSLLFLILGNPRRQLQGVKPRRVRSRLT